LAYNFNPPVLSLQKLNFIVTVLAHWSIPNIEDYLSVKSSSDPRFVHISIDIFLVTPVWFCGPIDK
jgi:hypothetical protein